MAYRFLFLTLGMIGSMLKAVRSRGGGLARSVRTQGKMFAEVFALVFIRSFERAERVQRAMEARGYRGRYSTTVRIPRPGFVEYAVLVGFAAAIVLADLMTPFQGW
jgi:cobalt/nickel transport system permease protein